MIDEQDSSQIQAQALLDVANRIPTHLSIVGRDCRYQMVNDAYLRATLRSREELIGSHVGEVLGEVTFHDRVRPHLERCFLGVEVRYQAEFDFPGYAHSKVMEVRYAPITDESNQVTSVMVSANDVTEHQQRLQQLDQLANLDPLTRLPNRRAIRDILAKTLARAMRDNSQCHVIFCDLNDFKRINDEGGHDHGDAVLREVSSRLRSTLRCHEEVGRWGGDEFLVVVGETLLQDQHKCMLNRLRDSFRAPIVIAGGNYQLGISLGSASYPDDGADIATLLRLGDQRMYHNKSA